MQETELLKTYSNINKNSLYPIVKILVSYIKPSFLFKSDILTPIHLGRAVAKSNSKDGVISDKDLCWLYENCIGDDDFEGNISSANRRVGFFTGTYWAWKNYEKLGNPQYFGSFGYRRLLDPSFLDQITEYDAIIPRELDFKISSIKKQITLFHGEEILTRMLECFKKVYPNEYNDFETYLNKTKGFFWELYVFKKEIFFDFCSWILPILQTCLQTTQIKLPNNDLRDIGFIMERLTGYYCFKLTNDKNLKILKTSMILTEKALINKNAINPSIIANLRNKLK